MSYIEWSGKEIHYLQWKLNFLTLWIIHALTNTQKFVLFEIIQFEH